MKERPKGWVKVEGWDAWVPRDWKQRDNIARLRFFREFHGFDTQREFAEHIGVESWNNYEPAIQSRKTAFTLHEKFRDFSPSWIYWGWVGDISAALWRAADKAGVPQQTLKQLERKR